MMTLSTQSIFGAPGFTLYPQNLYRKLGLHGHYSNGSVCGCVCVCPKKVVISHFAEAKI